MLIGQRAARYAGTFLALTLTSCTWSSTSAGGDRPHDLMTSTGGHAAPTVSVQFVDGSVVDGPPSVDLDVGDTVVIEITSDVDEQLHIHGYDILVDIEAEEANVIEFRADLPGRFEAEFEGRHQMVLEIRAE